MIAPTPFFADRGCHVRIRGEASALMALGNKIVVCTYGIGRNVDGIPTERTVRVPWYKKLSAGPSIHKVYIDFFLLIKTLLVCKRFRPDIIHAHLHEGIVIGKIVSTLFRIPLIADIQGSLTDELLDHRFIPKVGWVITLMRWIEKKITQLPSHVLVSSTRTAQMCIATYGIPSRRVTTITDGVDLDMFHPRERDQTLMSSLGFPSLP